jgi:hypothetical protein
MTRMGLEGAAKISATMFKDPSRKLEAPEPIMDDNAIIVGCR